MPELMGFNDFAGQRLLEVGCGMGTDLLQFARGGAKVTGVDLTPRSIELSRRHLSLYGQTGEFAIADCETLPFADESFDVAYSNGVLHHTPDTAGAVREVHRVLKPGGRAVVMLYHRNSYNYRVNIGILRRLGARMLRYGWGLRLAHWLSGEPIESLRDHAAQLRADADSYLSPDEFLNQNTDGAGNPLARVYSRRQARELFSDFTEVQTRAYFLNKRWIPVLGNLLPRSVESWLASRWGLHLWIYAVK